MTTYESVPTTCEAFVFDGTMAGVHAVNAWMWKQQPEHASARGVTYRSKPKPTVEFAFAIAKSDYAVAALRAGDAIIAEPDGDGFYPCRADVFAKRWRRKVTFTEVLEVDDIVLSDVALEHTLESGAAVLNDLADAIERGGGLFSHRLIASTIDENVPENALELRDAQGTPVLALLRDDDGNWNLTTSPETEQRLRERFAPEPITESESERALQAIGYTPADAAFIAHRYFGLPNGALGQPTIPMPSGSAGLLEVDDEPLPMIYDDVRKAKEIVHGAAKLDPCPACGRNRGDFYVTCVAHPNGAWVCNNAIGPS